MNICLLADENLNNDIIRGVLRQNPAISFQRTQEIGLDGCSDPEILQWAADHNAIVVTHDVNTMIAYARQRIDQGLKMSGLILVLQTSSLGSVIQDLVLLVNCSSAEEWVDQIIFLPFPS